VHHPAVLSAVTGYLDEIKGTQGDGGWREQRRLPAQDRNALKIKDKCARLIPGKCFGKPAKIARAVVFRASDESASMVGREPIFDGGLRLRRAAEHLGTQRSLP